MAPELPFSKAAIGSWGVGHSANTYCLWRWDDITTNNNDYTTITDAYPDTNAYAYTNTYTDTNAYAYPDTNAYPDTDACADTDNPGH